MKPRITILDLARHRNPALVGQTAVTGGDLARVGLPMFAGCFICKASLAAYNACPGTSGYVIGTCCADDINTYDDVERCEEACHRGHQLGQIDADLFDSEQEDRLAGGAFENDD